MKRYPPRRRPPRHPRVPAFVPVPSRARRDGWTTARQAAFLGELALTRSVSQAARRVGMARETAYRLRDRIGGESFAAAWDQILGREAGRRKVTAEERRLRALFGRLKPMIYRGEHVGNALKPDNSALLGYWAQLARGTSDATAPGQRSQGFAGRFASTPDGIECD